MHRHVLAPALLAALLSVAGAAPASAQFDFGSWAQRAQMIANQLRQISNQTRQLQSMTRQVSELENQLDHMRRAARGELDALTEPFSRLAAGPVDRVGDGVAWGSDFGGASRETVEAVRRFGVGGSFTELWRAAHGAADRVGETDVLDLHRRLPPRAATRALEDHRRDREAADRRRVLDYAALDAAAALAETVESARGSFVGLTANGNLSNTALQQAGVAAALSRGRIDAAVGQALAHQLAREAGRARQAELARLEWLARWREGRARANGLARTLRAAASANRDALRTGLLLRVPSSHDRDF